MCLLLLLLRRTCFINGRGVIVLPEKKKRHFYLILFVSYFYLALGNQRKYKKAIPIFSSGDSIAFSKYTSIPPAPIPFLLYVTCNAALEAGCVLSLSGYFHGGGSMRLELAFLPLAEKTFDG